jgi:hypothetical protein
MTHWKDNLLPHFFEWLGTAPVKKKGRHGTQSTTLLLLFFKESWPLWECTFFHAVITLIIILVIILVII